LKRFIDKVFKQIYLQLQFMISKALTQLLIGVS
jgi:hypothetical protein